MSNTITFNMSEQKKVSAIARDKRRVSRKEKMQTRIFWSNVSKNGDK
jgi:hypothetical protein